MIKSLTALAISAVLGASVIALPGFAPRVEAREAVALPKADRIAIRPVVRDCAQQVWPNFGKSWNFGKSCLRSSESGDLVREVRLVTPRR
jgi:hypothetical protein